MVENKLSIPQQSYKRLTEIIIGYTKYRDSASIKDISEKFNIREASVSVASGFLIDLGILKGRKGDEKRIISDAGARLGKSLMFFNNEVKDAWYEIVSETPFFHELIKNISSKKITSEEKILSEIFNLSDTPIVRDTITGGKAIIKILCTAEILTRSENKKYILGPRSIKSKQVDLLKIPQEIKPFIEKFKADYPDPHKCVFIMMAFGNRQFHSEVVKVVKNIFLNYGIVALRADDKSYSDDLFANVKTYMYGCGQGVAIFERVSSDSHNPNVSLEVGFMMALDKPVLLLKDSTLNLLPFDLIGRLYKPFDTEKLYETLSPMIEKWLIEKSII
ncbi:MAG: hypothetical protein IH589_02460 [Anaerolineales bacterium]|nr:hypothetical protein [Anaerolineales bacterium]